MPDWKSLVSCRLQHLWPDGEVDADIVEELTAHLKDRYDERRGEGLSDREAVEATLNEMSDSDRFDLGRRKRQQQARRAPAPDLSPGRNRLTDLCRDLRYGAR